MSDPVQASHEQRSWFERMCFRLGPGIVVVTTALVLFGIAYPPPAPDLHAADWGAAIVTRANQAWPVLALLLSYLIGGPATTLLRGHMDARLTKEDS